MACGSGPSQLGAVPHLSAVPSWPGDGMKFGSSPKLGRPAAPRSPPTSDGFWAGIERPGGIQRRRLIVGYALAIAARPNLGRAAGGGLEAGTSHGGSAGINHAGDDALRRDRFSQGGTRRWTVPSWGGPRLVGRPIWRRDRMKFGGCSELERPAKRVGRRQPRIAFWLGSNAQAGFVEGDSS